MKKSRAQNIAFKSSLRTAIKSFEATAEAGDTENAKSAFVTATKKIDKAASKGLIHKNAAARQKSRLAKKTQWFVCINSIKTGFLPRLSLHEERMQEEAFVLFDFVALF